MRVPERKAVDDKVIERMLEVMREKRISQRELVEYLGGHPRRSDGVVFRDSLGLQAEGICRASQQLFLKLI